jgi:hypothetical protein
MNVDKDFILIKRHNDFDINILTKTEQVDNSGQVKADMIFDDWANDYKSNNSNENNYEEGNKSNDNDKIVDFIMNEDKGGDEHNNDIE